MAMGATLLQRKVTNNPNWRISDNDCLSSEWTLSDINSSVALIKRAPGFDSLWIRPQLIKSPPLLIRGKRVINRELLTCVEMLNLLPLFLIAFNRSLEMNLGQFPQVGLGYSIVMAAAINQWFARTRPPIWMELIEVIRLDAATVLIAISLREWKVNEGCCLVTSPAPAATADSIPQMKFTN